LQRIRTGECHRVTCTGRTISPVMHDAQVRSDMACHVAHWPGQPIPEVAFDGIDTVIHLAAATGRLPPEEYFATNVDGTRDLLGQCRRAGVRNFLFVSTIAARFPDLKHYPYAQSKRAA